MHFLKHSRAPEATLKCILRPDHPEEETKDTRMSGRGGFIETWSSRQVMAMTTQGVSHRDTRIGLISLLRT